MIAHPSQSGGVPPHKIMVVDDNSATRRMVRNALVRHGHEVIEAADGKTARELMRSECPRLVLQDLMLPDTDGFLLVGELRELAQSDVSILAFSGFVSKLDEARATTVGFDDIIAKPIAPSRLVPLIEAHLPTATKQASHSAALPEPARDRGRRVFRQLEREVMRNAGLAKRCSLLASELTVLTGIAEAVLRQRDIDTTLDEAMVTCFDAGGVAFGALYTFDETSALRVRKLGADVATRAPLATFFGRDDILRDAIATDRTIYIPSSDVAGSQELLDEVGAKAILLVPLPSANGPLGALMMVSRDRDLEEDDWRVFSYALATQISQVLTLAKAYKDLETVEAKVARQAAVLKAIVDNAPDYVTHVDRDGVILFLNRARKPGMEAQLLGRSWFECVLPEQRALARRAFDSVLATGNPAELELKFPRDDGSSAWLQLRLGPIGSPASGCIIVARDVTENKQSEMQLMLADRMASVGTLAAGVAHEINNPLAAVIANLDIAEQDLADLGTQHQLPQDLVEAIRDARVSADRVREIVRDLRVFSRAQEDIRGAVDVEKVLNSALRMAWNELRHRAKVEKQFSRVLRVDANEGRLGQVFLNLIVNAIQAIPEGDYQNNYIRIATDMDDNWVVITISDTGVGMPIEVERRLFTPFFTTKPAGVGTGLGLAISHRIISDYGGTIDCDTELHKGTTFRIKLPIAPANLPPVTRKFPLSLPPKRRGRILVIDDETSLVQAIRRYLAPDHDVDGVTSARTGIDLVMRGTQYDAIVCDLMMPQITGMEIHAAVLKLDPALAERIVFVTGGAFTESARAFLARTPDRKSVV